MLNRGLEGFGYLGIFVGLGSSFLTTVIPNPVTHKKQSPWLFVGDVAFTYIGNKMGPAGFATGLTWSFVFKPTIENGYIGAEQPSFPPYGQW